MATGVFEKTASIPRFSLNVQRPNLRKRRPWAFFSKSWYQLYGDTAFDPDVPPFEDEEKLLELLKERDELLEERAILLAAMAFFEKKTRE